MKNSAEVSNIRTIERYAYVLHLFSGIPVVDIGMQILSRLHRPNAISQLIDVATLTLRDTAQCGRAIAIIVRLHYSRLSAQQLRFGTFGKK